MGVRGDKKRRDGDNNQDPFLYMPGIVKELSLKRRRSPF